MKEWSALPHLLALELALVPISSRALSWECSLWGHQGPLLSSPSGRTLGRPAAPPGTLRSEPLLKTLFSLSSRTPLPSSLSALPRLLLGLLHHLCLSGCSVRLPSALSSVRYFLSLPKLYLLGSLRALLVPWRAGSRIPHVFPWLPAWMSSCCLAFSRACPPGVLHLTSQRGTFACLCTRAFTPSQPPSRSLSFPASLPIPSPSHCSKWHQLLTPETLPSSLSLPLPHFNIPFVGKSVPSFHLQNHPAVALTPLPPPGSQPPRPSL